MQWNAECSQRYGPSEPSGIGPILGILGLSTPDPVPNTSVFLSNADGVAVFARFTMPFLWTHVHGIAARMLSYDAPALLMNKDSC